MKDLVKLLIVLWVVKKFLIDNDLLEKVTTKIKDQIKDFLK